MKNGVSAVMVSHVIVNGAANSEKKPAVVSKGLVGRLRNKFTGLIITDEINMLGLKQYYSGDDRLYVDLFKAGNDLIINSNGDMTELQRIISLIEDKVIEGEISEDRIDDSLVRILNAKGINVAR